MRSDKELLQLLLDNKNYFEIGLCLQSKTLLARGKISEKENLRIKNYLNINVDTPYRRKGYNFYWPMGEWESRKEWLKQEINKLNGKRNFFTTLKRWFNRS